MPDVRGVLFDFGNTLFAHPSLADTIIDVCRHLGEPQSTEWALGLAARVDTAAHTAEELLHPRDFDADVWRSRWHVLYAVADDEIPGLGVAIYDAMHDPLQWRPYTAARSTLARIHAADVPIAIVSNTGWDVRSAFVAHDLDQFVDEYVLSYEVGAVKPDARIFQTACDALGVAAAGCLMVGDDARADSGAVTLGLRVLLVPAMPPGSDNGVDAAVRIVLGE